MATGFVGSYVVIRCISGIFGGYPNEFQLAQMIKYKELEKVPWQFYVYMVFIILLSGSAITFQYYLYWREQKLRQKKDIELIYKEN